MKTVTVNVTENSHAHIDMICAKAANMELIMFAREGERDDGQWYEIKCMPRWRGKNYFLCHRKHKYTVLRSLNGEVAEFETSVEEGVHALEKADWHPLSWYMFENTTSRIKPRKEKRWIAYNRDNGNVYGVFHNIGACIQHHPEHQHIEIEIEVNNI